MDGLFLLIKIYVLVLRYLKIKPRACNDWIDTDATINGKTIALDGDRVQGDALMCNLPKTELWQSYFFTEIFPLNIALMWALWLKTTVDGEHFFMNI